jgi:hypothetical protein
MPAILFESLRHTMLCCTIIVLRLVASYKAVYTLYLETIACHTLLVLAHEVGAFFLGIVRS